MSMPPARAAAAAAAAAISLAPTAAEVRVLDCAKAAVISIVAGQTDVVRMEVLRPHFPWLTQEVMLAERGRKRHHDDMDDDEGDASKRHAAAAAQSVDSANDTAATAEQQACASAAVGTVNTKKARHGNSSIIIEDVSVPVQEKTAGRPRKGSILRHPNDSDGSDYSPANSGGGGSRGRRSKPHSQPGKKWESSFLKLTVYQAEHGHCHVTPTEDKHLSSWCETQMRQFRASNLSAEKVRRLSELDFDFDGSETKESRRRGRKAKFCFDEMLEKLKSYKALHGDCRVPCTPKTELSRWVERIRQEYRNLKKKGKASSTLDVDRLAQLTDVGFVFNARPGGFKSWEERMEKCQEFKQEHGHLKIPTSHPELGVWVGKTRGFYKQNLEGKRTSLTPEKQQQLDDMGFVWLAGKRMPPIVNTKSWSERLEEFEEFKRTHGHPFVPQHLPGGLGRWVSEQRRQYKWMKEGKPSRTNKMEMTAEKALKLSDAGFAFEASFIRRTPKSALEGIHESDNTSE